MKEKEYNFLPEPFIEEDTSEKSSEINPSQSSQVSKSSEFISLSQEKDNVNALLKSLGLPAVNFTKTKKKKVFIDIVQSVVQKVNEKLSSAIEKRPVKLYLHEGNEQSNQKEFMEVLSNLRMEYIRLTTNIKKLEVLTLLPKNWKYAKISEYFPITRYIYQKLNDFERNIGKSEGMPL